jgi:hypothetical protein
MTRKELAAIVESIIIKNLSSTIKPIIQKTVLEELGLVLVPAIKKAMAEMQNEQILKTESEIPVSEYRKTLMKNIGLTGGTPKLANQLPNYNAPAQTGNGVSGILAETLNDIRPGELDNLGIGNDYSMNQSIPQMGFNDMGYQDYNNFNPTPVDLPPQTVNPNNPLAKLEKNLSKNYSTFLAEMDEHANNKRGAIVARNKIVEDQYKQRLGSIMKSDTDE